jgi:predicted phage terminase large subunit-like protein
LSTLLDFSHPSISPERPNSLAKQGIITAADYLKGPPKPDLEPLDFKSFVKGCWHVLEPTRDYLSNWSTDAIIEHLEAVARGQIQKLVINVPPGSMKSLSACVMWPAWVWGELDPSSRWLVSTYATGLALRDSTKCRRLIKSAWYQERYAHVYQILPDEDNKKKFENDKTGFRQCITPRGEGTGNRGDFILADDLHKVSEAVSEKKRQFAVDWWNTEMSNRGSDRLSRFVVVSHRVHEFDVPGACIEQGYELLKIPQEYEPANNIVTCIGWKDPRHDDGDLMWNARFDDVFVADQKLQLGAYSYSAQHQQRPTPAEGGIIKREYLDVRFDIDAPPKFDAIAVSVDTAEKPGIDNAYSVFLVFGITANQYHLMDVYRRKVDAPTLKSDFYDLCTKWKPNIALIEDKSSGTGLIQYAQKETRLNVIPVKPDKDKIIRLINESPSFAAHKVVIPQQGQRAWVFDYVDELTSAPNGQFLDQCDSSSQFLRYMRENYQPKKGMALLRSK